MEKKQNSHVRLGALDICIILIVIVCAVSIGFRYMTVRNSSAGRHLTMERYLVSVEVRDVRDSSAKNHMEKGTNFYLEDTNVRVGTLQEGVTITDAAKFYEMPNGELVQVTNTSGGDLYRVDMEATLECEGVLNPDGAFLLNGNQAIGVNQELKLYSKYLAVTGTVTAITKAE